MPTLEEKDSNIDIDNCGGIFQNDNVLKKVYFVSTQNTRGKVRKEAIKAHVL